MGQAFPVDMNLLTQHEKPTITNVGFKIDIELDSQVRVVVKSSFYQLRQLAKIKPILSKDDSRRVIHAFITTPLDYCNSLVLARHPCRVFSRCKMLLHSF